MLRNLKKRNTNESLVKKWKVTCLAFLVLGVGIILVSPINLFLNEIFDLQIFTLTLLLIIALVTLTWQFAKQTWQSEYILAILSLCLGILFFLSDSTKKDLEIIDSIRGITGYNCLVAKGILDQKKHLNITYGRFDISIYLNNLGFLVKKFNSASGTSGLQIAYNMAYVNNLFDSMAEINFVSSPKPKESYEYNNSALNYFIELKKQAEALTEETVKIIGCK